MKVVVPLFVLCIVLPGWTRPALAQNDGAARPPAPAAPSGTASPPAVRGTPGAPAPDAHQKEKAEDVTPPEPEEVPDVTDPYGRDPYENEPVGDEGTVEDAAPMPEEPSVGAAHEPDDSHAVDEEDTEPDDAAEE